MLISFAIKNKNKWESLQGGPTLIHKELVPTSNQETPYNLNKEQPKQFEKALNNQPHTIYWVQNQVGVRKGITTGLCKNQRANTGLGFRV